MIGSIKWWNGILNAFSHRRSSASHWEGTSYVSSTTNTTPNNDNNSTVLYLARSYVLGILRNSNEFIYSTLERNPTITCPYYFTNERSIESTPPHSSRITRSNDAFKNHTRTSSPAAFQTLPRHRSICFCMRYQYISRLPWDRRGSSESVDYTPKTLANSSHQHPIHPSNLSLPHPPELPLMTTKHTLLATTPARGRDMPHSHIHAHRHAIPRNRRKEKEKWYSHPV